MKRCWPKHELEEVADLCLGKMLDKNKNKGELHPYLGNLHVRWGSFDLEDLPQMRFERHEHERYGLKNGDLVVCEGGEPGRCALWKNQVPNMKIQKALHRVRPHECLDSRYLLYWFLEAGQRNHFEQFFTGATIKHLPGEKLAKIKVDVPPLPIQRHIAGILSAYDELIENCQRRIRILEQMARGLYREWFVKFRFPNHIKTLMVDSPMGNIPNGWEVKLLADLCESVCYGYTASASREDVGPNFLRITDIVPDLIDWANVPFCEIPSDKADKYALRCGDIVVARTGATTGYAKRLNKLHPATVFASYLVRVRAKDTVSNRMLGILMEGDGYKQFIKTNLGGAAQPQANAVVLTSIRVATPPSELMEAFDQLVEPILDESELLSVKIQNLRKTRDLLLPRLMSGQINVN